MNLNLLPFFLILTCFSTVQLEAETIPDVCPKIVTKIQWGGRAAITIEYALLPVEYVIIHHTFTPLCTSKLECSDLLTGIQNFHMDELHFDDIGYNFMIGGDGNVYEGRGWHKIGAHTKNYNSRSLSIAFLGTFSGILPDTLQLQAAKDLIKCGVAMGEISKRYKLFGARQVSATRSPGLRLYEEIMTWPHFAKTS